MKWFLAALKKYADFSGRARRSEYWFFALFFILICIGLVFIDGLIGTVRPEVGIGILTGLFILAMLVPSLAVTVRRLHDTDRSGWWYFIQLVPLVGPIVLFVFTVQDSQAGANRFGPNPKAVA